MATYNGIDLTAATTNTATFTTLSSGTTGNVLYWTGNGNMPNSWAAGTIMADEFDVVAPHDVKDEFDLAIQKAAEMMRG